MVVSHPPVPYVVGAERSGTTLVRALLDAHPAMAIPPESDFLVPLLRSRRRYERDGDLVRDRVVEDVAPPAGWDVDVGDVRRAATVADDVPGVVRELQRAHARAHGAERWGDKTPIHLTHVSLLADAFPEAVFVHVVRDPRDVAASLRDVEWGPDGLVAAADRWRRWVVRGRRQLGALGPGRHIELRYEELAAEPERVLRSLLPTLGLPWDAAVLDHPARAAELLATTPAATDHGSLREPVTAGLRDWRRDMPAGDVAVVEAVVGRALVDLGYSPSGHGLPWRRRLAVLAAARRIGASVLVHRAAHAGRLLRSVLIG